MLPIRWIMCEDMPLAGQGLKGTKLAGEYNKVQMFEDGNWLPVTVIKHAKEM